MNIHHPLRPVSCSLLTIAAYSGRIKRIAINKINQHKNLFASGTNKKQNKANKHLKKKNHHNSERVARPNKVAYLSTKHVFTASEKVIIK